MAISDDRNMIKNIELLETILDDDDDDEFATAINNSIINEKRLTYDEGKNLDAMCPPDLHDRWRYLLELFASMELNKTRSNKECPSVRCPESLTNALKCMHKNVADLSKAFFSALKASLDSGGLIEPATIKEDENNNEPIIVFRFWQFENYAIGIARDYNGEPKHQGNNKPRDCENNADDDAGVAKKVDFNHCACLVEKQKNHDGYCHWNVVDCLSIVKLTMKNCKAFSFPDATACTIADSLGREEFYGRNSIAQVLLDTMGWVVPGLAKLGQLHDAGPIPWAVIVGNQAIHTNQNQWVSGKIYPPEYCCEAYQYAVNGFEVIMHNPDKTTTTTTIDETINCALSVYLGTLLFGLNAAKKWIMIAKHARTPVPPVPASGKQVMFGGRSFKQRVMDEKTKMMVFRRIKEGRLLPDLNLIASPFLRRPIIGDKTYWKANQGELFTGKLNLHQVLSTTGEPMDQVVRFNREDKVVDVVVKASSLAVHRYFTHPYKAYSAMEKIMAAEPHYRLAMELFLLKQEMGYNCDPPNVPRPPEISDVLFAAHYTGLGLITIMADLTKNNYHVLEPMRCGEAGHDFWKDTTLSELWLAFVKVLESVLIPMAELDIVHPDIRPGFNETSNILVSSSFTNGDNNAKVVTMKVIDYESITRFLFFRDMRVDDHRYVNPYKAYSAPMYLWWQCVLIAYAWFNKKSQLEMSRTNVQRELSMLLSQQQQEQEHEQQQQPAWLTLFGNQMVMTYELAKDLATLASFFDK